MDEDNIVDGGHTSFQIVVDWFTTQENCNKYHGANRKDTKNTTGITRLGCCVQVSNIIIKELGKYNIYICN